MDYPRDYIIPNQEIELGTAFVVMPIRPEFDLPLGIITDVCNTLGIKARRADDIARQDFITPYGEEFPKPWPRQNFLVPLQAI